MIPSSEAIVNVSIIDTGARVNNVNTTVFLDQVIGDVEYQRPLPAYSFLIEHKITDGEVQRYLYDLSIRKDLTNLSKRDYDFIFNFLQWDVPVPNDVVDILEKHGEDPKSIDGVIWSHSHWDHTGCTSRFPPDTKLLVGPGTDVAEDASRNREVVEIAFDQGLKIGGLDAIDFFGDGSFYLLDSPGHCIGHISALARTTPTSFILMGGDFCHSPGAIRPTSTTPLPSDVELEKILGQSCSCSVFEKLIPSGKLDEPFYTYPHTPDGQGPNVSRAQALETRSKMMVLDGEDNVFMIIAHDESLLDVLDFFPSRANDWLEKEQKAKGRWRFLRNFIEKA